MSQTARTNEVVAGRYAIEAPIASGGMGAVYRAFDRVQNKRVALKRLIAQGNVRHRTRMFEREFYTLAGLKHPRIIEVYEYGIDDKGAYYTMELLGGRDLRELAPLPYRTACRYLRDLANCLALLHARGLLHRDISPRNVRITEDDRAKLFDFGTLSSFGLSRKVMGTPPGIPPESVRSAALDQRADLYSLGALAYWMVTGRHAYHARNVDQLPELWRKPLPAPSLLVPKKEGFPPLPQELDALIASLLDHNPLARPVNAAEVVARLTVIAQLESDDEPLSALSYLHGGKAVGRARPRAKLRKCVKEAIGGAGSVVAIEAEAGMGSGRMLADLAIEAQLLGATAIVVDARAQPGAYGVIGQLAGALFAIDPEQTRAAMGQHAAALARFSPDAAADSSVHAAPAKLDTSSDPREGRMRLQAALQAWFERLAEHAPLVIAIRGLQRADDGSAALLLALAQGIEARRMSLVLAFDPQEVASAAPACVSLLRSAGVTLELHGFSREEVHELVRATFGAVQNTERLSEWLHELTSGNPRGCADLLQHLIEQQVVRFIDGMWVLPKELSRDALPTGIDQALDARVERLSDEAKKLALALAVHRAATPLERCLALAELEGIAEPQRALAELSQRGVLEASDDDVRFGHSAVHDALLRRLDDGERRRLHAQFGRLLEREARGDAQAMLDAGWHLLHGGEERRGADLLADLGAVRTSDDWLNDMIPALEAALEVYRRLDYPKMDQARLLTSISGAGFFSDRRFVERYGDEALEMMQEVLGLNVARRWQPRIGRYLALVVGLGVAFGRMVRVKGLVTASRRFVEALTLLCTAVVSSTAVAALTMDAKGARRAAAVLDPLRAMGADSAAFVLSEYARALAKVPEDRLLSAIKGSRRVVERLEQKRPIIGLVPGVRQMVMVNGLYAWGALEALRESPEALRIASRLDASGLKLGNLYSDQIRACYHGIRGEAGLAEGYQKRVELFALQSGAGWVAEIWAPTSAILFYLMSRDGVGIRRVMGELERLSAEVPSLQRYARLARATYYVVHGDDAAARDTIGELIDVEPRSFNGWLAMMGTAVRVFARTGEREHARALGKDLLAKMDADERAITTLVVPLMTELAWVEAELGEAAAGKRIDDYLIEIGPSGGPVTLGTLHETRARIALLAADQPSARAHLAHVKRWFTATENPVLLARYERLQRDVASGSLELGGPSIDEAPGAAGLEAVRAAMHNCLTAKDRAVGALDLLLQETGADAGFLFAYEESELTLVCKRGSDEPPSELRDRIREEIESTISASSVATRIDARAQRRARPSEYRVIVLSERPSAVRRSIMAAAIADRCGSLRAPAPAFIGAVAESLTDPTTSPAS